MKIFFDSNIFLRYLIPEHTTSYNECTQLIAYAQEGALIPYVSNVVIQEVVYVLTRIYKSQKSQVIAWLHDLFNLRNLTIIEKTNSTQATRYFQKYSIKFGDCLIATQIHKGTTLCTYDTDFQKLNNLFSVSTPHEIIASMSHPKTH